MKWSSTLPALLLAVCLSGCSTISSDDVANLKGKNDALRKESLARLCIVPGTLDSVLNIFRSRGNERKAISILIESLAGRDNPEEIDVYMLRALGELGKHNRVPYQALADRLTDERPLVRYRAAEALGKIKSKEAVPALIQSLDDAENKYTVIWALGEIRDKGAVEPLNRLWASSDRYERYNAGRALSKIR
ncbi:MAG TPA: HEAT repeat domain-containing protein [Syntrophobacteraceae bacterium]|nr:HEAT repeat domain-containing protein [Syntrophobacteraceae bacterium]